MSPQGIVKSWMYHIKMTLDGIVLVCNRVCKSVRHASDVVFDTVDFQRWD